MQRWDYLTINPHGSINCTNPEPIAAAIRAVFPKARAYEIHRHPIRHGIHSNTAFALVLAHDWALGRDVALAALIAERAQAWFSGDRACQAWEPSGDEFLSPALTEALLMARLLPGRAFQDWFDAFLPDIAMAQPATLLHPALVSDRSDGKIAHLDGLNLSRAWCWRNLGQKRAAEAHLAAGLPHVAGDYMGEHWLATFALLALEPPYSPKG